MAKVFFFLLVFAGKILFQSFLAALLAQIKKIKTMPLANRSSSLLTNHGNRTDNSSLHLYRKFRFRQASDFD